MRAIERVPGVATRRTGRGRWQRWRRERERERAVQGDWCADVLLWCVCVLGRFCVGSGRSVRCGCHAREEVACGRLGAAGE